MSDAEHSAEPSASAEAWWDAIDASVLDVLAAAGGRLTVGEIGAKVGMSEDAARSVVTMLAEQGKVRIAAVEVLTVRRVSCGWRPIVSGASPSRG